MFWESSHIREREKKCEFMERPFGLYINIPQIIWIFRAFKSTGIILLWRYLHYFGSNLNTFNLNIFKDRRETMDTMNWHFCGMGKINGVGCNRKLKKKVLHFSLATRDRLTCWKLNRFQDLFRVIPISLHHCLVIREIKSIPSGNFILISSLGQLFSPQTKSTETLIFLNADRTQALHISFDLHTQQD